MKFVIDDKIPFIKGALEPFGQVRYLEGPAISNSELKDVDALIIRTRTICSKELLSGTRVRFLGTTTIGTDHIDEDWCDQNGVRWTNAPGCNSGSVMQYIASSLLHIFLKFNLRPENLTLGVVGVGNVGSKVVKLARTLGMTVILNDPPRERNEGSTMFVTLSRLLKESDIITLHVPLIMTGRDKTTGMVNDKFLNDMKSGAFLINSSRGKVISENDIIKVLKKRKLNGCILDVWDNEPYLNRNLLDLAEIGTPHIAGYSQEGKATGTAMVVRELGQYFNLPLTDWKPEGLTEPDRSVIDTRQYNGSTLEKVGAAIFHTYPVFSDNNNLRNDPGNFEQIRDNYWGRREFEAYTVTGDVNANDTLLKLGFKDHPNK
ncbi:MAG TPA: 4-phosphoerythronate dehydrogenase [Bacteroidales bacterium]|nr:4-phosphoerythronate dehydrogenase [Bacteroidales bacterium]